MSSSFSGADEPYDRFAQAREIAQAMDETQLLVREGPPPVRDGEVGCDGPPPPEQVCRGVH